MKARISKMVNSKLGALLMLISIVAIWITTYIIMQYGVWSNNIQNMQFIFGVLVVLQVSILTLVYIYSQSKRLSHKNKKTIIVYFISILVMPVCVIVIVYHALYVYKIKRVKL